MSTKRMLALYLTLAVFMLLSPPWMTARSHTRQPTPTPYMGVVTPRPSPTGDQEREGLVPTPSKVTDLASDLPREDKAIFIIRHADGQYEDFLLPWYVI